MGTNSHLQAVPRHVCTGTTYCVLCGKRTGAILFKGRLICKNCVDYARAIS
jgi:hypothetical protein